jgi:hypothetical protein
MTITIAKELLLFRIPPDDYTDTVVIPPGKYSVENAGFVGANFWWKLEGKEVGNSVECWEALRPNYQTKKEKVIAFCRKSALVTSILLWACLLLKTDEAHLPHQPDLPSSIPFYVSTPFSAIVPYYTSGYSYTAETLTNGEYIVTRFASGPAIVRAGLTRQSSANWHQPHVIQVHKDLLLLIMLITLIYPNRWLVFNGFKFILPVLLLPVLKKAGPVLGLPQLCFYVALACSVAALVWNNRPSGENARWVVYVNDLLNSFALFYFLMLLFMMFYTGTLP